MPLACFLPACFFCISYTVLKLPVSDCILVRFLSATISWYHQKNMFHQTRQRTVNTDTKQAFAKDIQLSDCSHYNGKGGWRKTPRPEFQLEEKHLESSPGSILTSSFLPCPLLIPCSWDLENPVLPSSSLVFCKHFCWVPAWLFCGFYLAFVMASIHLEPLTRQAGLQKTFENFTPWVRASI